MAYSDPVKQKQAQRSWYQRNQALTKERLDNLRRSNYQYVKDLKEATPCADCGQKFPAVCMDFDHVDGEKLGNVSRIMRNCGIEKLRAEIEKCEIVCANCHRIRTAARLG